MQIVAVEVDKVEAGDILEDQLHEPDMVGERFLAVRVSPQGSRAGRDELRPGLGIAAGEERDLVAQANKFLYQVGNNALRAAIQFRGNAFGEGGDLCNSHAGSHVEYRPNQAGGGRAVKGIGPWKMPLLRRR
jgi:hypothetical protein